MYCWRMASRPDRVQYENEDFVADALRMTLAERDPMTMQQRVNVGKMNGTLKEFISYECTLLDNPWLSTPFSMLYGAYKTRHRLADAKQRLLPRVMLKRAAELGFPSATAYGEQIIVGLRWNGDTTSPADRICRSPGAEESVHASLVSGVCDVCGHRVKLNRSHNLPVHRISPLGQSEKCPNRTMVREGSIMEMPECASRGWSLE